MAELVGCGTPCLLWSLGVWEVVGSRPGRDNSMESFSSYQKTGKLFSPDMPFYSKFKKNLKYVVPVGKCKFSYEVSSHVKNYAYSGKLLL